MIIIIIILNLKMQRENPLVSALNIYSTYMYFLLFKEMQKWHLYTIVISSPLRSIIFVLSNVMQFF